MAEEVSGSPCSQASGGDKCSDKGRHGHMGETVRGHLPGSSPRPTQSSWEVTCPTSPVRIHRAGSLSAGHSEP